MRLKQLHSEISHRLAAAGLAEARREAALLMTHGLAVELTTIYSQPDRNVTDAQAASIRAMAERRADHEPLAYVTGRVLFMNLEFVIGPGALVPRPDSEVLVETALTVAEKFPGQLNILDTCAGTGCIGISLAEQLLRQDRLGHLLLADLDATALEFASQNICLHPLAGRVSLEQTDLFPSHVDLCWDMIVANPPYIASALIPALMPEVSRFEPRLALDGGTDGLDYYRRLIDGAAARLRQGGALLVEHGFDQAAAVAELFESDGRYVLIPTVLDYGGQPRVTGGFHAKSL